MKANNAQLSFADLGKADDKNQGAEPNQLGFDLDDYTVMPLEDQVVLDLQGNTWQYKTLPGLEAK